MKGQSSCKNLFFGRKRRRNYREFNALYKSFLNETFESLLCDSNINVETKKTGKSNNFIADLKLKVPGNVKINTLNSQNNDFY